MWRPVLIALAGLALSACAGNGPQNMRNGCACDGYLTAKPRPAWVDAGDQLDAAQLASSATAMCSGVRQIDFDAADLSARGRLSRVISTKTDFSLSETRTDEGFGAGRREARIDASQISRVVLEGSRIDARWVDPQSCLVHARATLSRTTLAATKARLAAEEAAKPVNQMFFVEAQGRHGAALAAALGQALSEAGVSRLVDTPDGAYLARARLDNMAVEENGLSGNLSIALITPGGETIWQRSIAARAASYSKKPEAVLVTRAVTSALRDLAPALAERLQN